MGKAAGDATPDGMQRLLNAAELLAMASGLDHGHPERTAAPRSPQTARAAALAGTAAR